MSENLDRLRERFDLGGSFRILGLGDSLTAGWEVQQGFFDRFIANLARRFQRARFAGINAGVPGDTMQGGWSRLLQHTHQPLDLAVVEFGINDAFLGVSLSLYQDAVLRIVSLLNEQGCLPLLVTSCPLSIPTEMDLVSPFYRALGETGRRLDAPVADLCAYWQHKRAAQPHANPWNQDGVHPSDVGHAWLAEGLMAFLDAQQSFVTLDPDC